MYLKSLVLKGFKSFADRSVLGFEPGIAAVVGPNGSGKSNISDAVLWVLGERNAKNLRGQAMEDVIFAGSSARKPVGVAEVELVLDNSDGTLPVEFNDVSIMRRMYRSGESEYLINGTIARRMDVLDILHDSGLGTGTHSIIAQGHLAEILQSKPEDRRALIEEAAGVLKHKQRKAKSQRKLERMDEHLARVRDVVAEVERQVKPLERKAKRALQYRDVSKQLAQVNLELAVDDLRTLQRSWDETLKREQSLSSQLEGLRTQIEKTEAVSEELQKKLQAETAEAGVVATHQRRAQAASDKLDSNVLLLHERKRSIQSYLTDLQLQLQGSERSLQDLEERREQAQKQLDEAVAAREAADSAYAAARTRTQELQEKKRSLQQQLDDQTRKRRDALQELEGVRAAQARTQEILASSQAQQKLIATHAAELDERFAAAKAAVESAQSQADAMARDLEEAKKAEAEARANVGAAVRKRDELRQALDEARDERATASALVKSLEELERARTAANPLLLWTKEHADDLQSRIAPFIDTLTAAPEVEALVTLLLGSDVEALFVEDEPSALAAATRIVASGETGSVSLLPRDGMRAAELPQVPEGARTLVSMLSYPESAAASVKALLGDVLICEDIASAQRVAAQVSGVRAVTLDGVIVWPNGKVAYALPGDDAENALAAHRELEAARDRLAAALEAQELAQRALDESEEELRTVQSAVLSTSQDKAKLQGASDAAASQVKQAQSALDALKRESESIESQRTAAQQALEAAQPEAVSLDERATILSGTIDDAKNRIEALRDELAPVRAQADEASNALAEAKLAAATAKERTDYAKRMVIAREQDIRQAKKTREVARRNIERKTVAAHRIDPLLEVCRTLAEVSRVRSQRLEDASAASRELSAGLHEQINDARTKAKEAHDAFDESNELLSQVRVEKGRLEMQVETAIRTITDDCGTPLEVAMRTPELEDRAALEAESFKLQRRIANMGTINPDAAAEYEQLKTRYDYLQSQLDDMMAARRSLVKIVHVIDDRMKDDFVNTFEQVNANFQRIFRELFPGGSGELSLVDPDDPENTGVEVSAQPSGKRILKMSLMSGGEKSLVAMALLFAVYETRATPFYILDEIEAALDDTNLRRLVAYLDSIRDTTQFIMITHQRRTMEMADVLYGVSMQSDGVTKVMSQRLDAALRYAEG